MGNINENFIQFKRSSRHLEFVDHPNIELITRLGIEDNITENSNS